MLAGLHFGRASLGLAADLGDQPNDRAALSLSKIEPNAITQERRNQGRTESGRQAELIETREGSRPDQERSCRHRQTELLGKNSEEESGVAVLSEKIRDVVHCDALWRLAERPDHRCIQ
jgi:hypothetical protein